MSAVLALANPHRIKASHRRRRRVASGRFVQRYYDPMLGRFLSTDPLTRIYPMLTPYQYAESQPIWAIDIDGLEKYVVTNYKDKYYRTYKTEIYGIRDANSKAAVNLQLKNAHGNALSSMDVYEINQYHNGVTKDVGGRNNLTGKENAALYQARKMIPDSKAQEAESLPFEEAINQGVVTQKGQFNSMDFDASNHEFFEGVLRNKLPPVQSISKVIENINFVANNNTLDNSKKGISFEADILAPLIDKVRSEFKKQNPNSKVVLFDNITITTTSSASEHFKILAKELEKRIHAKINVNVDNTIRPNNAAAGTGSFILSTKVSGN